MQTKRLHYAFGATSFLVALFTYMATMQPSVPFWDCGEFAAAASALSVPHPPGAPLWTLVGRIALILPTFADPVARYNFFSVLSSAASILFLYLTIARLIRMWRGNPQSTADVITHYGGALIGALSYCFTDSFWFNALECEVYAFGSLFISLIPWLILSWYDHADEEHSEKYLLMIFYVIGLSMGVHQLALLTIFPVFMLVYYKRWPAKDHAIFGRSLGNWLVMAAIAVGAFWVAFKIILSNIVTWLGNDLKIVSYVLLAGTIYGIWYSQKNRKPMLNLALWAAALLFMGYSTYASIMVRASQDPPMNQWHASTFNQLHRYIDREQYGEARELPRRIPEQESEHKETWQNYSSDGDFFWRYQTNHMYLRYWLWNFVGRASDAQDAGVDWTKTWGIPLFLGLFGILWHFKRDPKRAFSVLAMFIMLGVVTAWYQNQQDPQPRERDYFYVGAFYAYAMWVGIGATGIMEFIRSRFARKQDLPLQDAGPRDREVLQPADESIPVLRGAGPVGVLAGVFALALLIVPINQCIGLVGMSVYGKSFADASKWQMYSRHHNDVPMEYAYNILQSCAPNAVLFTAGDNDTFPLWALQDVYGVRRDVRIVNLSLGNMSWYIKQLKDNEPWGAKKLNLPSFPEEVLAQADDSPQGVHPEYGPATTVSVDVNAATMAQFGKPAQPGQFSWKFTSQRPQQGQYIYSVADLLIKDIVVNNFNERPIYFAIAVPASYWVGLENNVIYEGMAARVVPMQSASARGFIDGDINESIYKQVAYNTATELKTGPSYGMILNSYRDPSAVRSTLDDHYGTQTYFQLYGRLANYYIQHNNMAEAHRALDTLVARVPINTTRYDPYFLQAMSEMYRQVGDEKKAGEVIRIAAKSLDEPSEQIDEKVSDPMAGLKNMVRKADLYYTAGQYTDARTTYANILPKLPGEAGGDKMYLEFRMASCDAHLLEQKGDKKAAYEKYSEILSKYQMVAQMGLGQDLAAISASRDALAQQLGIKDTAARPATQDRPKVKDGTKTGKP